MIKTKDEYCDKCRGYHPRYLDRCPKPLYSCIYPDNKEELINTYWKCPRCNRVECISEKGINHKCTHFFRMSLDDLYESRLLELKQLRRLLFNYYES